MNIIVAVKMVPDLVEELEIADSGNALDTSWLRLILNETDDHAIEQAILIKERSSGEVTVVAPSVEGVDDVLFSAMAKGADRLVKLTGDFEDGVNNHALARAFASTIEALKPDLVLTGVQAHDDLDGALGPLLAAVTGLPYVGYISGITVTNEVCTARKEYPGGLVGEMSVQLPAVLGIQAAEEPPRYVAISRIRQAMKEAAIEEQTVADLDQSGGAAITRMFQPESGERAIMLGGSEEEVAARLVGIFQELSVL
jgi:electron transfer flavoprotein beta subunit